jgi:tRNA(Ile)-lysidine synthase
MRGLGPFEPGSHLAVAVSGGADSLALAWLTDRWARGRGGRVTALVVDHGLRRESAAEADLTRTRLTANGIASRLLRLTGLARGPALAARARAARYAVLERACAETGILHLLLGHHANDQAETLAIRRLDGSGPAGLAGMAALTETRHVRRLRPLLAVGPGRLRATLRAAGLGWVEDPSNTDPASLRARLRQAHADPAGEGPATRAAIAEASIRGIARREAEQATADLLAARVAFFPQGHAFLSPGPIAVPALAALLRVIAGADYAPSPRQLATLAASPGPATLGGARILPAGRLRPGGWLVVREAAAMAPPIPAAAGAVWDARFALAETIPGAWLGPLGPQAAGLRKTSDLPAAVLWTMPAIRSDSRLLAVPHLRLGDRAICDILYPAFSMPAAGAPFLPADGGGNRPDGEGA